jgi:hypothetical protein
MPRLRSGHGALHASGASAKGEAGNKVLEVRELRRDHGMLVNPRLRTIRVSGELLPDGVNARMKRLLKGENTEHANRRQPSSLADSLGLSAQALARKTAAALERLAAFREI